MKLLDLGLARFYAEGGAAVPVSAGEEMTGTGQAMGTADYMAPEQASDSRTVDIRADLYSLGCTFYKLLSGRAPFSGRQYASALDKMNAHVQQPVPPIRNVVSDVPEELAAILERMLAKDPGERFATPAEVATALEPFSRAQIWLVLSCGRWPAMKVWFPRVRGLCKSRLARREGWSAVTLADPPSRPTPNLDWPGNSAAPWRWPLPPGS